MTRRTRFFLRDLALAVCFSGLWLSSIFPDLVPLITGLIAWLLAPRHFAAWTTPEVVFPTVITIMIYLSSSVNGTIIGEQFLIYFVVVLPLLATVADGQPFPKTSLFVLATACTVATLVWPDQFGIADWRRAPYELNEIIVGHNAWLAPAIWIQLQSGVKRTIGLAILLSLTVASWIQILPVGPVLAGAIALGLLTWQVRSRHRVLIRGAIVLAILGATYFVGSTVSAELAVDTSNSNSRWDVWNEIVFDGPMLGSGQDPVIFDGDNIDHAHNYFVDAFRLIGVPGLVMMIGWTIFCFRGGRLFSNPIPAALVAAHFVSFALLYSPSLWLAFAVISVSESPKTIAHPPNLGKRSTSPPIHEPRLPL